MLSSPPTPVEAVTVGRHHGAELWMLIFVSTHLWPQKSAMWQKCLLCLISDFVLSLCCELNKRQNEIAFSLALSSDIAHNRNSGMRSRHSSQPPSGFLVKCIVTKFGLSTDFDGRHFACICTISLNSSCVLCDFGPIARHEKPIFPSSRDSGQTHLFF